MKAVQFVTLLLFSLVTGVFWGTWFSLSRSISAITPGTFLEVGRLMIGNLGGPMSVLMPAALLSAAALCVVLYRGRQTRAAVFASAALALMVIALIITLSVNVPIDGEIRRGRRPRCRLSGGRSAIAGSSITVSGRRCHSPRWRLCLPVRSRPRGAVIDTCCTTCLEGHRGPRPRDTAS
jgi:hypothetical protein